VINPSDNSNTVNYHQPKEFGAEVLSTHVDEEKVIQFLSNGEIRFISPRKGGVYCRLKDFKHESKSNNYVAAVISPHYFVTVNSFNVIKFGRCMGNFERQCKRWQTKMNVLQQHAVGSDGLLSPAKRAQFIADQDRDDCFLFLFHYLEQSVGRLRNFQQPRKLEERSEVASFLKEVLDTCALCISVLEGEIPHPIVAKRHKYVLSYDGVVFVYFYLNQIIGMNLILFCKETGRPAIARILGQRTREEVAKRSHR
jgi:hypothetical protein